jgi:hypothetical protein
VVQPRRRHPFSAAAILGGLAEEIGVLAAGDREELVDEIRKFVC